MGRISQIEGLRAYLALWVLCDHVLIASGYDLGDVHWCLKLMRCGWFAVDVFIIISGFVIFFLLDQKREGYLPFVLRRFFRIWPLFMLLFAVTIPVSLWRIENVGDLLTVYPGAFPDGGKDLVLSWWDDLPWHVLTHIPMVHGMVPENVLHDAPGAFLTPTWSISLEWQFYLVAPIAFAVVAWRRVLGPVIVIGIVFAVLATRKFLPTVGYGAFLPIHLEFFFLGAASFYLYKALSGRVLNVSLFPIGLAAAAGLLAVTGAEMRFVPFVIWIVMFCLIADRRGALARRASRLFENAAIQYLGKISYSIYLAHYMVITLVRRFVLETMPAMPQELFFVLMLAFTLALTLGLSHFLYHHVERPGMRLGAKLATRVQEKGAAPAMA